MKEKIRNVLHLITNSIILAGGIILFIGMYYAIIKAGIPYQDPPLELQIRYEINSQIGDILTKSGFIITVFGVVCRLILGLVWRKQ